MFSCFSVFSLGTALLYRTAVCAATMYAQNGGKAFAQTPAAVSTCGKAGQKNMPQKTDEKEMTGQPSDMSGEGIMYICLLYTSDAADE